MTHALGTTLRALERFLLPNACLACNSPVEPSDADGLICSRCRWGMKSVLGGCPRCAQPLPPIGGCRACAAWPPALTWARSAVWLGPEARALVHHLKYGGYTHLAPCAAAMMVRCIRRPDGMLLPVPLTGERERARGYNQAEVLAQALAVAWQLPLLHGVVQRHRQSPSQTLLTPGARADNVAGAFLAVAPGRAASARHGTAPPGRVPRVIIVDDVFTTGATIAATALALSEAGWPDIGAVTFASALPIEVRLA